jgi:hypothetical protein
MNKPASLFLCVGILLSAPACKKELWYPVPEQRPSFEGFPQHITRLGDMADPDADLHIVRDIMPKTDTPWRWTGPRPAVRIRIRGKQELRYSIDFTLPDISFKDTGPVTITFTVNDHVLDRILYTEPGYKHFEKPVPPSWLPLDQNAIVGAEIDKMWKSPDDGKMFGFIISRMGLKE